jgi:hypothetical protein
MKTILAGLAYIFVVFRLQAEPPAGGTTTILQPTAGYEWGTSDAPEARPSSSSASNFVGETILPKIQAESQRFAEVMTAGDVSEVAKRMLPSVLKSLDSDLGQYLRQRLKSAYDQSFKVRSVSADVPQAPQLVGDLMVSFVPIRTYFTYDDGGKIGKQRIFGPTSVTLITVAHRDNRGVFSRDKMWD